MSWLSTIFSFALVTAAMTEENCLVLELHQWQRRHIQALAQSRLTSFADDTVRVFTTTELDGRSECEHKWRGMLARYHTLGLLNDGDIRGRGAHVGVWLHRGMKMGRGAGSVCDLLVAGTELNLFSFGRETGL